MVDPLGNGSELAARRISRMPEVGDYRSEISLSPKDMCKLYSDMYSALKLYPCFESWKEKIERFITIARGILELVFENSKGYQQMK